MYSSWKAISDGNRRKILTLLKKRDMNPTAIAKHFDFTLPGLSAHLRTLKGSDLIVDTKKGKNIFYSLNREKISELMQFFISLCDCGSFEELVENKHKTRKWKGNSS